MYVENLEMKNSLKWAVQGDRSRCDQNGDTMVTKTLEQKFIFQIDALDHHRINERFSFNKFFFFLLTVFPPIA